MAEPTSLEVHRGKKQEVCDYCGGPEHPGAFQCPRIKSVTFDNENDTVTIRLWDGEAPSIPKLAG